MKTPLVVVRQSRLGGFAAKWRLDQKDCGAVERKWPAGTGVHDGMGEAVKIGEGTRKSVWFGPLSKPQTPSPSASSGLRRALSRSLC